MKVLKEYEISDKDGRKLIRELANGLKTETVLEPSASYIASLPLSEGIPRGRDYSAELDDLKSRVTALEAK